MLFPVSFKLALTCCSCLHHLLPWVASCSLVMHHACVCIMPCSCVVCLPCCVLLLDSFPFRCDHEDSFFYAWFIFVASSVRLFHGLVLLPCGISGKMTATLDLTTIIAMLIASFYRFTTLPIFCLSSLPNCHEPLTFNTLPSKPLFGYVTALLSPSYSVVSCRWSWRFLHGGQDFVGISQYLLF